MITKRKLLTILVPLGFLSLFAALLLPGLARSSNCGGNSAALNVCREIRFYVQLATNTNDSVLDQSLLDSSDQTILFHVVSSYWTPDAGYWVRTNHLGESPQKKITVVCDVVYDNVPLPTLWNFYHRNPAHAVGFSDGTTGLISPADYARMDRTNFLNLTALAKNIQP